MGHHAGRGCLRAALQAAIHFRGRSQGMAKPKVFVTRGIYDEGLDLLKEKCDVEVWPGELPPPRDVLLEKVEDVEGLLSLLTDKVDDELLDAAPKLRGRRQPGRRLRQHRRRRSDAARRSLSATRPAS